MQNREWMSPLHLFPLTAVLRRKLQLPELNPGWFKLQFPEVFSLACLLHRSSTHCLFFFFLLLWAHLGCQHAHINVRALLEHTNIFFLVHEQPKRSARLVVACKLCGICALVRELFHMWPCLVMWSTELRLLDWLQTPLRQLFIP